MVHSPDWSQNYSSVYNVPWLLQQMQTYLCIQDCRHFHAHRSESSQWRFVDGQLVDNIDLHVNGSTAITAQAV